MAVVREDVIRLGFDVDSKKLDSTLGKLDSGITKVTGSLGKFSAKVAKTAFKGIATGAATATTTLIGLGTAAVKSYAEYEQLVGGVETLFGAGGQSIQEYSKSVGKSAEDCVGEYKSLLKAQDMVLTNANDAYKSAGLSANEYMSTVTSFSASMISSLGGDTVTAAKLADQAIVDMADNANKMGTDMESIQNAYQGFAKQNYTMLDNLKLGYGGTKEEMQRLLKDAQKLTGKKYDISNFADITEAIHAIQTEMGITGTTAKEASETIQGSALAMKAAWQNFLTGMANEDADFDQLMSNLVDSVKTFLKNIIPRIKKMLPRLVKGLTEITKAIGKELPGILEDLVPSLVDGAGDLTHSLFSALVDMLPMFKQIGLNVVKAIYKGITGKEMPDDMFAKLSAKVDEAFEAVKNITAAIVDFTKKLWVYVGPALIWIGDLALDAFSWIGDNISWILPVLSSLLGAMLAFKAVKRVTGIVSGFFGLFGKKGGAGGGAGGAGGGGFLSGFASMKPTTILKAMANIGIIVGGLASLALVLAWAAPYFRKLTDGKSFAVLLGAIGAVGLIGTGLTKLAGMVGKIPVAIVAKGLLNIGITMVALGAVTYLLGWAASKITFDNKELLKLVSMIGIVGLIGSAVTGLAGLIGAIPIPMVLTGLANIALVLGGITGVIVAFGALSQIDGFNDFITNGGNTLVTICGILGQMAGSVIGGLGEGITNSLPTIGENISAFATSIAPAMTTFSEMNFEGLTSFASAFGTLILALTGEKIASWFTGGIDYAKIGTDLTALTTNASGFFTDVQSIPEAAFTNATALFQCLNGIGLLPNSGGVVQWFTGEVDYESIATGLNALAGTTTFFTAVEGISQAAFDNATKLFECLNGIGLLPNSGGVMQWFTGDTDYQGIADGLAILGGESFTGALSAIAAIPVESFTALSSLFTTLAGVSALPETGGIFDWFTGDSTQGLTAVASQLPGVATNIASFFTNLGGQTDFTTITDLFNAIGDIDIDADAASKGFLSLGTSDLEKIGFGLSSFATNAKTFFDTVNGLNADNITTFFEVTGKAGDLPTQLEGIDGTLGTTLSNMCTTVESGMKAIKSAILKGLDTAIAIINGKYKGMYDSGAYIMDGLNLGILSKESVVMTTVRRIANNIKRTFDDAQKIGSPAKVMIPSGEWTTIGVAVGMRKMLPEVESAAVDVSSATSIPYVDRYRPDSGNTTYYGDEGNNEVITISPIFNLQISGSQDDRVLARKVKRFVAEGIADVFESLERKSSPVREV